MANSYEALDIVYRDRWLVAIRKPAGLLVHRSMIDRHERAFAVQRLRDQLGQRVHPLHRLDKGTSGLLLFALDADTAARASRLFEKNGVDKRYLAVVRGHPADRLIDHPLRPPADDYAGSLAGAPAQAARTRIRCLATITLPHAVETYPTSRYALIEARPEEGRRHQIRRHLKHISHPIIGDANYGRGRHNRFFGEHFGCRRLLLAATGLRLIHPCTGQPLALSAAPCADFLALIDTLGWRSACENALEAPWGD